MKTIFVDTSALIAIGNKRDTFHLQAVRIREHLKQMKANLVTTNGVLLEFGNAFSPINLKPTAIKVIEAIFKSKKWNCVNIDYYIMQKGFELYKQMQDKSWGFVDCSSIVVAKYM